jgi:hypothetical protein
MKPRHAAALALVGWYLLAPPIMHDPGHWHPNLAAPLNQWIVAKSFDSAVQCEKRLADDNNNAENPTALASMTEQMNYMGAGAVWHSDELLREMVNEHCISSDDPRLKQK